MPQSIEEALQIPSRWDASHAEIQALEQNDTWEIIEIPPNKWTVGYRSLFTTKHNTDGSLERFKAHLIAKEYTQAHCIDYQETFIPVGKYNTIRILLSLACNLNWPLNQLDLKNAFLNGELEEEFNKRIPPGYENRQDANKVCKLKKSLYGLKQSLRAWFGKFTHVLRQCDYSKSQADPTLFSKILTQGSTPSSVFMWTT